MLSRDLIKFLKGSDHEPGRVDDGGVDGEWAGLVDLGENVGVDGRDAGWADLAVWALEVHGAEVKAELKSPDALVNALVLDHGGHELLGVAFVFWSFCHGAGYFLSTLR